MVDENVIVARGAQHAVNGFAELLMAGVQRVIGFGFRARQSHTRKIYREKPRFAGENFVRRYFSRPGRQAKRYRGKSSRKICAAWREKEERVAIAGAKRLRITQPLARFHSLASAGQPMCFVHLPFSVEY